MAAAAVGGVSRDGGDSADSSSTLLINPAPFQPLMSNVHHKKSSLLLLRCIFKIRGGVFHISMKGLPARQQTDSRSGRCLHVYLRARAAAAAAAAAARKSGRNVEAVGVSGKR